MSKHKNYSDEPLHIGKIVADFLPSPEALVKREEKVKITLEVTKSSLDFFKQEAEKQDIPYQRMLRGLIDKYVEQQQASSTE